MGVKVREKPIGSGEWWIFINHNGRRKSKKVGRDKKTAIDAAKKIEAKLTLKDFDLTDDSDRTETLDFKTYATIWLENYVKPLRRKTTYERYRSLLKIHVFPVLGAKKVDEIRRSDIRDLILLKKKAGVSRSTLNLIRDAISGPLNFAFDEELIPGNPSAGILKRLQLDRVKQIQVEPLNEHEVNLFLSTAFDHFREHYEFFLTACRTGARLGELLALRWGDIDWNRKVIRITKSYKRGRIEKTKTGKDRRVDMSDQLLIELKQLYTERKKEGLRLGIGEPVELLFHRGGKPIEQNYIRRVFKRVLVKAGIREIRLHDLRHTFASLLLTMGQSPVYVKEQLGHSSIKMTVDVYGHLIPSSNRDAVNRLDSMHLSAPQAHPVKQ
jgi:integrase